MWNPKWTRKFPKLNTDRIITLLHDALFRDEQTLASLHLRIALTPNKDYLIKTVQGNEEACQEAQGEFAQSSTWIIMYSYESAEMYNEHMLMEVIHNS